MSFDKWFDKNFDDLCTTKDSAKDAYEAGAQSQQAEIDELKKELETLQGMHNAVSLTAGDLLDERDELQKRIDELLVSIDWHIEDCDFWLVMNKNDSWKGGQREILKAIKNKLKGNQND